MKLNYKGTKMNIIPAVEEEQIYCYSSDDESQEKACIGHLRGDFGTDGNEFWTSWFPHQGRIICDEIRAVYNTELDHVVEALRENGLLQDRATMSKRLCRWPKAKIENAYSNQIALCIETQWQLFYLRCNPIKGDYNFCLYAYNKAALMEVQRQAKHLPAFCFTRLKSTGEPIRISYGANCYAHVEFENPYRSIEKQLDELNEYYCADKAQIAAMVMGSMFGWHTPAANPKMYDKQGLPLHSSKEKKQNEQER